MNKTRQRLLLLAAALVFASSMVTLFAKNQGYAAVYVNLAAMLAIAITIPIKKI